MGENSLFQRALRRIEENRNKEFNCISFESIFPRFSEYLPGIMQKTYYLVTANSKAGKTQITDFMFLYHPYNFIKQNPDSKIKLKIFYYSLEMDLESKITAGISKHIYETSGQVISTNTILSMNRKNRLSDDIYSKIKEAESYFEELEDYLVISDAQQNPTGIYKQLYKYALDNGTIKTKIVWGTDELGNITSREVFDRYIPNNPNEYVIILTDHLAELASERGFGPKETMEKHSDYMRILRNMFGYIPVDVQQQSAAQESLDKFKANKLEPSIEGLGETKLTARKANVILGLFNPFIHEIPVYRNYDITKLQDNYRNLSIIRQRNGESGLNMGLYFNGACNYFKELPTAKNMTSDIYSKLEKVREIK